MTDASQTSDTMRERASASSWKLAVLLGVNRWVLALALAGVVFVGLLGIAVVHPVASIELLRTGDPVETLFQAYVGAVITGVTLVLTLNQLVLSQEFGAVGDQRERMQAALSFRRDVEDVLEAAAAPPEPSAFLRALVVTSADRAADLADAVDASDASEAFTDAVDEYAGSVGENAAAVEAVLADAQFGTFDVVFAALDYDYAWKIAAARRLRMEHAEESTDAVEAAFDDLEASLRLFGTAREHFKTLYFQWELVDLSRAVLYAAFPALVASTAMIVFFDPDASVLAGTTLGVSDALAVVALAATVATLPFAILAAFVLRIATVAKRTLSIGPFVLRETDRHTTLDRASGPDDGEP